jgi:hypothetical protein
MTWRNECRDKMASACVVSEIVQVCLHFMNSYLGISVTFCLAGMSVTVCAFFIFLCKYASKYLELTFEKQRSRICYETDVPSDHRCLLCRLLSGICNFRLYALELFVAQVCLTRQISVTCQRWVAKCVHFQPTSDLMFIIKFEFLDDSCYSCMWFLEVTVIWIDRFNGL